MIKAVNTAQGPQAEIQYDALTCTQKCVHPYLRENTYG